MANAFRTRGEASLSVIIHQKRINHAIGHLELYKYDTRQKVLLDTELFIQILPRYQKEGMGGEAIC